MFALLFITQENKLQNITSLLSDLDIEQTQDNIDKVSEYYDMFLEFKLRFMSG